MIHVCAKRRTQYNEVFNLGRIFVSLTWKILFYRKIKLTWSHTDIKKLPHAGADLGGGCRGCAPLPEMTRCFLIQLVFCKKKTMWFIGVEVEEETSAPPPKKNPGSAPVMYKYMYFQSSWQ